MNYRRSLAGLFIGLLTGFGIFVFVLGATLFYVGENSTKKDNETRKEMRKCTAETTATVTHLNIFEETITSDDNNRTRTETTYDATLTFTSLGQEYSFNYDSRSSIKEGDTIDIKYDPNDPERAFVAKEVNYMLNKDSEVVSDFFVRAGKFLLVIGTVFILFSIVLNIVVKGNMRKAHEREMQEAQRRHDIEMQRRNNQF